MVKYVNQQAHTQTHTQKERTNMTLKDTLEWYYIYANCVNKSGFKIFIKTHTCSIPNSWCGLSFLTTIYISG